jgi:sulfur carrier protein
VLSFRRHAFQVFGLGFNLDLFFMRIIVNGQEMETAFLCLEALVMDLQMPLAGLAVAVGSEIVPRHKWASFSLKENDEVMLISATRGG